MPDDRSPEIQCQVREARGPDARSPADVRGPRDRLAEIWVSPYLPFNGYHEISGIRYLPRNGYLEIQANGLEPRVR